VRTFLYLLGAALLGVLAALATVGVHRYLQPPSGDSPGAPVARRMPTFALPDLEGRERRPEEWAGKVLVVNFWATWCPPCLREIPAFTQLQASYGERGVQFIGIAIDDAEKVREFVRRQALNYPVLLGDTRADALSRQLGNRIGSLPYTVVVDSTGEVRAKRLGEYERDDLEKVLIGLVGDGGGPAAWTIMR
jgi:thiol-disulfide isomerase/thioredoxin